MKDRIEKLREQRHDEWHEEIKLSEIIVTHLKTRQTSAYYLKKFLRTLK